MLNFFYTKTNSLNLLLEKVENLRSKVLTIPITPKNRLKFRWEAIVDRVWGSLALDDISFSKAEVARILSFENRRTITRDQQAAVNYKKAMDYIYQNWYANPKNATGDDVLEIFRIAVDGSAMVSYSEIKQTLSYIQMSMENPIIQAGLATVQGYGRLSRLCGQLFLDKAGYDFGGFIAIEEYLKNNKDEYKKQLDIAEKSGNANGFLDFYTKGIITQLEKAKDKLTSLSIDVGMPSRFFELNDRQKEILAFLDNPNVKVTNRSVQKMFKTSQITSSRDLARLTVIGFIFPHGKGRAVYYTKI